MDVMIRNLDTRSSTERAATCSRDRRDVTPTRSSERLFGKGLLGLMTRSGHEK
jgi:hypothetical protein